MARWVWLALCQGGAGAFRRLHICGGAEVPHAWNCGRRARGAEQADAAVRLSGCVRGQAHGSLTPFDLGDHEGAAQTAPGGQADAFVVKHTADWEQMEAGDRINFDYGGGGGWGDPCDRPAAAVLDDVLDEYVSVEGARRDYGVVLTGSLEELTLSIDSEATEARRAEMRAARSAD